MKRAALRAAFVVFSSLYAAHLFRPDVSIGLRPMQADRRLYQYPPSLARSAHVPKAVNHSRSACADGRRCRPGVRRVSGAAPSIDGTHQRGDPVCAVGEYWRGGRPGYVDELEVRLSRAPVRRREGWGTMRSAVVEHGGIGAAFATLHGGDDPIYWAPD